MSEKSPPPQYRAIIPERPLFAISRPILPAISADDEILIFVEYKVIKDGKQGDWDGLDCPKCFRDPSTGSIYYDTNKYYQKFRSYNVMRVSRNDTFNDLKERIIRMYMQPQDASQVEQEGIIAERIELHRIEIEWKHHGKDSKTSTLSRADVHLQNALKMMGKRNGEDVLRVTFKVAGSI